MSIAVESTEKKMTIAEFIKEAELFPYSRENFDTMKEASEIDLMAHYIESQQFMSDNTEYLAESAEIVEGYLFEAMSEEEMTKFEESFGEKMKGFGSKVATIAKSVWTAIINFFRKLGSGCKSLAEKATKLTDKFKNTKLSEQTQIDIKALVNKAIDQSKLPVSESGLKSIRVPKKLNINDTITSAKVTAALTGQVVLALTGDDAAALNDSQITEFFGSVFDPLKVDGNSAKNGARYLDRAQASNAKKCVLNSTEEAAKSITDRLIEVQGSISGAQINYRKDVGEPAALASEAYQLATRAKSSAAKSFTLFGKANNYRTIVINGLEKILEANTPDTSTDDKKDETEAA